MRGLRVLLLLSVLVVCGTLLVAGDGVSTQRFTLLTGPVPAATLTEITGEKVFQDALQVLASQNEEADLARGTLVTQEGDTKQYQASFPVRDRALGCPGQYMELVFVREPDGVAFVYFDCLNEKWMGPSPIPQTDERTYCPPWEIVWTPWEAVGHDCYGLYNCGIFYNRQAYYTRWMRLGLCHGQLLQYQFEWTFLHCGCPVTPSDGSGTCPR